MIISHSKIIMTIVFFFSIFKCETNKNPYLPSNINVFSIYIVEENIYGKYQVNINDLKLSDNPILTSSEITNYYWKTHTITYPDNIYQKLIKYTNLLHKGFVVTVGKERIYWGLFQFWIDSFGCQNPVIILYPKVRSDEYLFEKSIIILRSYFEGEGLENTVDPRTDIRIYNSLKLSGVLVD